MKRSTIHRGKILQQLVDATRTNKSVIAERAGYSRASYYKHIQEPELEYRIITAYGKAIKHDFTKEFPEMPKYLLEEPDVSYSKDLTIEDAREQIEYWKNKYVELLEKYNHLIEEQMKK